MAVGKYKAADLRWPQVVWLMVTLFALCTLLGCAEKHNQAGATRGKSIVGPFQADDENPFRQRAKRQSAKQQQAVLLTVYRITFDPQAGSLEQLWSLLAPARLLGGNSELLARNGMQIASGGAADWPKVVNLLGLGSAGKKSQQISPAVSSAKVKQIQTWLTEGLLAELPLSASPAEQMLFWRQGDGQLVGKTYEDCYKLFVVTAVPQASGQVLLNMTPALKDRAAGLRSLRWQVAPEQTGQQEDYMAEFEPLALNVVIQPNEFLALGRAAQAAEAGFAGVFFRADQDPQPATTLLLIVPRYVTYHAGQNLVEPDNALQIAPTKPQPQPPAAGQLK